MKFNSQLCQGGKRILSPMLLDKWEMISFHVSALQAHTHIHAYTLQLQHTLQPSPLSPCTQKTNRLILSVISQPCDQRTTLNFLRCSRTSKSDERGRMKNHNERQRDNVSQEDTGFPEVTAMHS